jgi:hypothetical protein
MGKFMTTATATAMTWHTEIAGARVTLTLSAESVARDMQAQRDQARVLLEYLDQDLKPLALAF